ncbi:MAG: hypothetical protein WBA88_13535 [Pseudaminobacter sp.]
MMNVGTGKRAISQESIEAAVSAQSIMNLVSLAIDRLGADENSEILANAAFDVARAASLASDLMTSVIEELNDDRRADGGN